MITLTTSTPSWIVNLQQRVHDQLDRCLPAPNHPPTHLHQAMRYAMLSGGKRIRPLLVYATGLALNADLNVLDAPATAIELIHGYSLVHDDLPAMDNDDYRRNQLSCHRAFDEGTAILVGDALQSLAFQMLSQPNAILTPSQQLLMIDTLATASGSLGMAGGQAEDLKNKNNSLSRLAREHINQLKTGCLFKASVRLGFIAATKNHDSSALAEKLDAWADALGLAFQLQDDVSDRADWIMDQLSIEAQWRQAQMLLDMLPISTERLQQLTGYAGSLL